jgi:hypothetical protein
MNMQHHPQRAFLSFRIVLLIGTIFGIGLITPLHAGFWEQINESLLLRGLAGKGRFIEYQRARETQDLRSPLEVVSEGFKMIRVYQDFPDNYRVEWTWRIFLKNSSSSEVAFVLEYTLRDADDLLVASSKDTLRRIAAGESVMVEKIDYLPHEQAKRAVSGHGYIHLQN